MLGTEDTEMYKHCPALKEFMTSRGDRYINALWYAFRGAIIDFGGIEERPSHSARVRERIIMEELISGMGFER